MPDEIDTLMEKHWDAIQKDVSAALKEGPDLKDFVVVEDEENTKPYRVIGFTWDSEQTVDNAKLGKANLSIEGAYEMSAYLEVTTADIEPTVLKKQLSNFVRKTLVQQLKWVLEQVAKQENNEMEIPQPHEENRQEIETLLKNRFEECGSKPRFLSTNALLRDLAESLNLFTFPEYSVRTANSEALILRQSHGPRVQQIDDMTLSWQRQGTENVRLVLRSWFYLDIPKDSAWKLVKKKR